MSDPTDTPDTPAEPITPTTPTRTLQAMLDRLFASMVNGPAMNCRPHNSRQRIDLTQLARFDDLTAPQILSRLLGDDRTVSVVARVPASKRRIDTKADLDEQLSLSDEERAAIRAYRDQQSALSKLRAIADDARTYENDTGVGVLYLGWPLLSMPPGTFGGRRGSASRRILAPIALLPINVTLKTGAKPGIELVCRGDGVDLVMPNDALLAWLEQQTGQPAPELFGDDEGLNPWREIAELTKHVAKILDIALPEAFQSDAIPTDLPIEPAPRSADDGEKPVIVPAAVLGLYPLANQGLLRDTQQMMGESLEGPIRPFISVSDKLDDDELPTGARRFGDERFVTLADPFQARTVKMARTCRGLVMHGPPGTGKSQTITNIIGDHLARGQRVLFVCDKRTALDVVANRLAHLGIGQLCAVVHDPQRDQRELYKSIREQLDQLSEQKTDSKVDQKLAKLDNELSQAYGLLTQAHDALLKPAAGGSSFHDLVGNWLATPSAPLPAGVSVTGITPVDLDTHASELDQLLSRVEQIDYAHNPWRDAAGIKLADLLARPMQPIRDSLVSLVDLARSLDATANPAIPPFADDISLVDQSSARMDLATKLESLAGIDQSILKVWSDRDGAATRSMLQRLNDSKAFVERFESAPIDAELSLTAATQLPDVPTVTRQLETSSAYLGIASRWYAFLCFSKKRAASEVLQKYAMQLSPANATRLEGFLQGYRARVMLRMLVDQLDGKPSNPAGAASLALGGDESLGRLLRGHRMVAEVLHWLHQQPALASIAPTIQMALADPQARTTLITGLRASPARATAIDAVERPMNASDLFDLAWRKQTLNALRQGSTIAPLTESLAQRVETLEQVLRTRDTLAKLPPALGAAIRQIAITPDVDLAMARSSLLRDVLAAEITQRLATDPALQQVDPTRLIDAFTRIKQLEAKKRDLVTDQILLRWVGLQQARLLAGTGSRLNSLGADMRRRLMLRGERALRLRQVVAMGSAIEGGDPLFDLRPVWMASPETVAQVFPRLPVFDVVVFDEASQLRLEESLPVLVRGRRVVIAGDPKQLPPTRFFESAVATSEEEQIETEQDLFEAQQSSVEDLLGAALNLSIQQSYLDVHYRSKAADLITFSNRHFYGSRLQAVPSHPSRQRKVPPITLYEVGGVYVDRANETEADKVVDLVSELLARPKPPSIGIACFNLVQRDLIVDKLDTRAADDATFARRLAEARERSGDGSFEGLFVKNLENVQGDERDHMIISTTYGPDATGRFRRTFGPLGQAGGARRLNVLVTRAREQIHLITSIPPQHYTALPPIPDGQTPGGGWLLFAYIHFAAQLRDLYSPPATPAASADAPARQQLIQHATSSPSVLVDALAAQLIATAPLAVETHWGNAGFNIDLAVHPADHPDTKSLGVLCDLTRFPGAGDPVEWEVFRNGIHESQGWTLHRIWSPQLFRDPPAVRKSIESAL